MTPLRHAQSVDSACQGDSRCATSVEPGGWLGLAATPTFAIMAMLSALGGAPTAGFCSSGHAGLRLGGMVVMYGLMSGFHTPAWLNLIRARRRRQPLAWMNM